MPTKKILLLKNYYSSIVIAIIAVNCLAVIFNVRKFEKESFIQYDSSGYYSYLPAVFIYDDFGKYEYYDSLQTKYGFAHSSNQPKYGLRFMPQTNKYCNTYPCGVAILHAPFFLMVDTYARFFEPAKRDGYSLPYQLYLVLGNCFYVLLGFVILRKFLLHYFSDATIAISFMILFWGTNLYNYTCLEPGLTHSYLFFLVSWLLMATRNYFQSPSHKHIISIAVCMGLICITRYIDVLFLLIPLMWNGFSLFKNSFLKLHLKHAPTFVAVFALSISPLLLYWKYTTGTLFFDSYGSEQYFDFLHPKILKGLFGYRKGMFLYTPLTLLGFLGIIPLWLKKQTRFLAIPISIFYVIYVYVIFSWFMYFYGWSFGCRPMVETYPLLAIPFCGIVAYLATHKKMVVTTFSVIVFLLISLNLFQTWQYHRNMLPGDNIDQRYYWTIFGRTSLTEAESNLIPKNVPLGR